MGEKCRVVFAKMLMEDRNLLILDEPTNHMDIVSRESVEDVLAQCKGTIILVTHDRYLAKRLATRVFEMEDHTVRIYEGGYEYYIEKKKGTTLYYGNSKESFT
jgi:ATPase subunit of ABC transporter with duplicated ATPase domains